MTKAAMFDPVAVVLLIAGAWGCVYLVYAMLGRRRR